MDKLEILEIIIAATDKYVENECFINPELEYHLYRLAHDIKDDIIIAFSKQNDEIKTGLND